MTGFERKGVQRQHDSVTVKEADREFRHSCDICASRGLGAACDTCPIAAAHDFVCDVFAIMQEVKASRSARVVRAR